ncbi:hypothetical protein ACIPX0_51460, partial [Streptomyces sp. NPDC090075]|uniref:hypothetical protein n=1 Tax=Streptomyces sp. NPDC090075 TaxID=3365937 RepID=UPI00380BA6A3
FRIQVSHRAQEPPSEFLPAEPGIQTERLVAHKVRSMTQRTLSSPELVRNKISTHPDALPTKISERKDHSSTPSETISKAGSRPNAVAGGKTLQPPGCG